MQKTIWLALAISFAMVVVACSDKDVGSHDAAMTDASIAVDTTTDSTPQRDQEPNDSQGVEVGAPDSTVDCAVVDSQPIDLPALADAGSETVLPPPDLGLDTTTQDAAADAAPQDLGVDAAPQDLGVDATSDAIAPDLGEIVSKGTVKLPFEYEFGATDQKMYFVVGGEKYPVELGAWGSHLGPQTGHNEGDPKVNYSVHIRPAAKLKELKNHSGNAGNNDGVCDPGELCGVTAQDAMDNSPWYVSKNDGWTVLSMRSQGAIHAASYVAGEKPLEYQMLLSSNGVTLFLYHLAEWSPALEAIVEQAVGTTEWNKFKTGQTSEVSFFTFGGGSNAPVIPKDTVLARPAATFSFSHMVDGTLHYYAHSQVEFNVLVLNSDIQSGPVECAFNYVDASVLPQLQGALEKNITDPVPFGRFQAYSNATPALPAVAQAKVCHSSSFNGTNFSTLESDGGYSWIDAPMMAMKNELFAITKVHKDTVVYAARQNDFFSAQVEYLFVRATAGLGRKVNKFTMVEGIQEHLLFDLWGEITDLAPANIQNSSGGFTVRIAAASNGSGDSGLPGKFFSASYRLDTDKIVVQWSSVATVAPAHPPAIPAGAIVCDGNPYYCYDHDYYSLWN